MLLHLADAVFLVSLCHMNAILKMSEVLCTHKTDLLQRIQVMLVHFGFAKCPCYLVIIQ